MSKDVLDRIEDKFTVGDGCWEWTAGKIPEGYGSVGDENVSQRGAHVVIYELLIGPVPEGMELDHLCRNTSCVSPWHLEAVTHQENLRRGNSPVGINARRTECKSGHPFDAENTYIRTNGNRACRECVRIASRAWKAKQKVGV